VFNLLLLFLVFAVNQVRSKANDTPTDTQRTGCTKWLPFSVYCWLLWSFL